MTTRTAQYSVRMLESDGSVSPQHGEWADTLEEAREYAAIFDRAGIWAPGTLAGDG